MRRLTLAGSLFFALASVAPASAEDRIFTVPAFRAIVNETAPDVVVRVGGAASVRAEGDAAALAVLDVRVENERLVVRTRPGARWPRGKARAVVHISTPSLIAATVSGSGNIRVDRVTGADFDGSTHGSGNLVVADLRTQTASLSSHGSGNVDATGAVGELQAFTSGSGNVDARRLQARTAKARSTGSGNVDAVASESADVTASGSGTAAVTGTRTCRVRSTGSGGVRCG